MLLIRVVSVKTYMHMYMNMLSKRQFFNVMQIVQKNKKIEYTKVGPIPFDTLNHLNTKSAKDEIKVLFSCIMFK